MNKLPRNYQDIKRKLQTKLQENILIIANGENFFQNIELAKEVFGTRTQILTVTATHKVDGEDPNLYENIRKCVKSARTTLDHANSNGIDFYLAGCIEAANSPDSDFDRDVDIYTERIRGIIDGGADILLMKSFSYTLGAKAAIFALQTLTEEGSGYEWAKEIPLFLSCILNDDGRMSCHQSAAAFLISIHHAKPTCIGIEYRQTNYDKLKDQVENLAKISDIFVSIVLTSKNEGEDKTQKCLQTSLDSINVLDVTQYDGTGLISKFADLTKNVKPKIPNIHLYHNCITLSGADALIVHRKVGGESVQFRQLLKIDQACAVPDIPKFRGLILDIAKLNDEACDILGIETPGVESGNGVTHEFVGLKRLVVQLAKKSEDFPPSVFQNVMGKLAQIKTLQDRALDLAKYQVARGSQVLNILFDPIKHEQPSEYLPGTEKWMEWFIRLIQDDFLTENQNTNNEETHASRTVVSVNSTKFDVMLKALKCLNGKSIANTLSFRYGEDEFKRYARLFKKLGAAVIVTPFMSDGRMAQTVAEKVDSLSRAYHILINELEFRPLDVFLDPMGPLTPSENLNPNKYGRDFIEAVKIIRERFDDICINGFISGVSQVFRSEKELRPPMNRTFLLELMKAGMDAAMLDIDDVADWTKEMLLEDLVLGNDPEASRKIKEFCHAEDN